MGAVRRVIHFGGAGGRGQGDRPHGGHNYGAKSGSGTPLQPAGVTGHDVMTGGAGADTFVQTAATTGNTIATADVITDFVSGEDKVEGSTAGTAANFNAILANGQFGLTVTDAAMAATLAGGVSTYRFVAGKSDGYLVETDAAGSVGVTTLTGDNSLTSLKYTDIIAGADVVPGGGATP